MYFQELLLIAISLQTLSANEFITVSTTHSPPPSQRKIRQEHDTYFDKQDQTCAAVTKNTYLLEIIKLQNAQIDTTLEKQTKLHQDAINSSFTELKATNTYTISEMKRELQDTKEQIVGNVITLLTNRLGNVCNLNQLRYTQVFIISEIQRILHQRLETHEVKLEESKRAIETRIGEIEKQVNRNGGIFSNFEKRLEETEKNIVGEIQTVQTETRSAHQQKLEDLHMEILEVEKALKKNKNLPRNCREIQYRGNNFSGVYYIQPDSSPKAFKVFCDMKTKEGGWIYLMNRFDGLQNFFLNWTDYKNGFGKPDGEVWLGLEHLYELTGENPNELLIELVDWDNKTAHAFYSSFSIGKEEESYQLKLLNGYSGDAKNSFSYHLNMNFSTADHSNSKGGYCANYFKGAWWYKDCFTTHLTGTYLKGNASLNAKLMGIHWNGFRHLNYSYSLKQARMMVRPQRASTVLLPHERSN